VQLAVTKLRARRLSAEVLCHTVPTMVLQGSPCATAPLSCHGGRRVAPTFIGIRTHEGRKPRNHPVRTARLKGAFLRVFIEGEVPKSSNYVNPTICRLPPTHVKGTPQEPRHVPAHTHTNDDARFVGVFWQALSCKASNFTQLLGAAATQSSASGFRQTLLSDGEAPVVDLGPRVGIGLGLGLGFGLGFGFGFGSGLGIGIGLGLG
jgi:hypothetical protein